MDASAANLNGGLGFSLAGLVVGLAVGATGVGGGSLMTPILILFYGISPKLAVGTDLLYACLSKSFGVTLYRKHGSVDWSIVGWQALGSVPASLATLLWLHHLGDSSGLDHLIKLTLSIAIVVTASFTLFQDAIASRLRPAPRPDGSGLSPHLRRALTVAAGALIGCVVTISSVGAGVIGMMLLLLLYPRHAPVKLVGSDLAHAVLITAIAGLGHAKLGSVNYPLLGWLLLGALPGILVGSRIGFRLDGLTLKRAVACLLLLVGSMSLYNAAGISAPSPVTQADAAPLPK
jgi:uncharacterized membrane protein YfcA